VQVHCLCAALFRDRFAERHDQFRVDFPNVFRNVFKMQPDVPMGQQRAVGRANRVVMLPMPTLPQRAATSPLLWETTREAPWEQLLQTMQLTRNPTNILVC